MKFCLHLEAAPANLPLFVVAILIIFVLVFFQTATRYQHFGFSHFSGPFQKSYSILE